MKKLLWAAVAVTSMFPALTRATDVGVSISVGDPTFFGRIDIGGFPSPPLIFPTPLVIQPIPIGIVRQPVYLRVPPGHEKHWDKHCARYGACGSPVYFVQDSWYTHTYAPAWKAKHGGSAKVSSHGHSGKGKDKGGKGHK